MQSVGSFFSSVSKFYNELNPATLSGAIDVVVVEQSNGDLACSPFHVRFGKLSILLPQEKVVEVEVNGHLVNFPMKVGDAGEAFFVFETEQDVPEEFATSPLAGPAQVKTEEEIDFLDLSQGGGTGHPEENNKPQAGSQDVIETGYVSAHSGHGSDFEEDENDCLSTPLPARKGKGGGSKTRFNEARIEIDDSGRPIHDQDSSHLSVGTRHAMSISLPASPVLKPYNEDNIMDIFKPVDTDGQGLPWRHFGSPTVQSPDAAPRSGFLTPYHNDVIMDMTGYKTDDSAETDLSSDAESESGSRKNKSLKARVKKARARPARKGRARQDPKQQTTAVPSKGADPANKQADPTLFTRGRQKDGSRPSSRSLSLPNLAELDDNLVEPSSWTGFSQTLLKEASSGHVKLDEEDEARLRGALEDLQRHENEQSKVNGPQQRRFGHKRTESQMQSKKQVPRPNSAFNALSDTELEYQTPRTAKETEWSWGWGSLPVKNEDVDEAIKDAQSHVSIDIQETPKPVPNEMTIEGEVYRVAISVCPGDDFGKDLEASETLFAINQISFEEFSKDPLKVLNNKNLVCLINDRYFTWAAAGPYLTSLMLFRKPLSDDVLHQLSSKDLRPLPETSEGKSQQETTTRFGALSRWLRGSQPASSIRSMEQGQAQRSPSMNDSPEPKRSSEGSTPVASYEPMTRSTSMPVDTSSIPALDERVALETPVPPEGPKPKPKPKRYAKTLRLTSEQLKSLNLKKGANSLTFSVTSSYQGKAICSARLFLWNHDYQVVISDIDGTITKSDALGHIFTMAGKDWTHAGVAKLYTDIVQNGYHILYLTSRAIGQADYTRKYLKGVEQDNYQLPDGPVIMSPDRLMTAFHREVIMRKPEEFKMACLRDIRRLFEDRSPFYAGFGNRITDALSYRSVNVPSSRIFTIDSGGEVKLELLSSYKSSYLALNDLVNEIFPGKRQTPEFNDWNFWKPTMPTIDLPMASSKIPPLPTSTVDYNAPGSQSGRLGVIRSFTSSLTSAGPLKKRSSIPAFSSTASTPSTSHVSSFLSPHATSTSTSPSPPPTSSPGGLQIADRTRRLSLSIMKYGSQPAASTSPAPAQNNTNGTEPGSSHNSTKGESADQKPIDEIHSSKTQGTRARGLSLTLPSSGPGPSGLRESHSPSSPLSTSWTASENEPSIKAVAISTPAKKTSSFPVSPPQLASVIPFLRGRGSRSEPSPEEPSSPPTSSPKHSSMPSSSPGPFGPANGRFNEMEEVPASPNGSEQGVEGGEYEDNDPNEEYEDEDDPDEEYEDDDDVDLDVDAPFL